MGLLCNDGTACGLIDAMLCTLVRADVRVDEQACHAQLTDACAPPPRCCPTVGPRKTPVNQAVDVRHHIHGHTPPGRRRRSRSTAGTWTR
jgi:hypothetical protein